ncbi:MAG TPA: 50S ribosomal protein L21 [Gaiellaceae bacterium]|jgi:large subunit ribosomal protein L21|nr:50S ribosomal protein L21 [Gaiellaceae bacterium]
MTYAIIKVAGKQYRVREGERLLVDRLAEDEGATFTPTVLLVGGDGAPVLEPDDVKVTAKVLGAVKGPKIRIGKYKKRTGYRRHTGFRASLTQIQIESIGGKTARAAARSKSQAEKAQKPATRAAPSFSDLPAGYPDMTIADIKAAAGGWDAGALDAALAFERDNANRKGAIAALESVLAEEGES